MCNISACIVVRNEEKLIKRCLESIVEVVDEIIVVHDGECGDKTIEICKKFNARVFVRKKRYNSAEPHRPFSYRKARFEWIFQIDADEYLSEGLRKEIPRLARDENVSAYEFLWPIWDEEKQITER